MAIAWAFANETKRRRGESAVRVTAYNARTLLVDERTGLRHNFNIYGDSRTRPLSEPLFCGCFCGWGDR
jgi:hypothetical protein